MIMLNLMFLFLMYFHPRRAASILVIMILCDVFLSIFIIKFVKEYYDSDE